MAQNSGRTITIRYTPAARSVVYETRHTVISASDVHDLIRKLNRTKISTLSPYRPKGGEIYVYRSRIIGKGWRADGYERVWRSNGTHYYPRFGSLESSKQHAVFKVVRHVAFDRVTNLSRQFRRTTFIEMHSAKENPLTIVHYIGDESQISDLDADRPHGNVTHGKAVGRSRVQRMRRMQQRRSNRTALDPLQQEVAESTECEVVHHMEITASVSDDGNLSTSNSTTAATSAAAASTPAAPATTANVDEDLREASALGDIDRVASLLAAGADINAANRVNGWTALHWSAKRGHAQVVGLLLGRGANPEVLNAAGQTPGDVASCDKLSRMLGGAGRDRRQATDASASSASGFVPNYLRNPEFPYVRRQTEERRLDHEQRQQHHQRKQTLPQRQQQQQQDGDSSVMQQSRQLLPSDQPSGPLLLQVRIAESDDPDFIEIELGHLSYDELLDLVCQEMSLDPTSVERIRKLPNVRLRNDRDVARLLHGQQLEIVLRDY